VLLGDPIACDFGQGPIVSLGPCCGSAWKRSSAKTSKRKGQEKLRSSWDQCEPRSGKAHVVAWSQSHTRFSRREPMCEFPLTMKQQSQFSLRLLQNCGGQFCHSGKWGIFLNIEVKYAQLYGLMALRNERPMPCPSPWLGLGANLIRFPWTWG